jgi:hypothetical protein
VMPSFDPHTRGRPSVGHITYAAWTFIWPPAMTRNGPPATTSGLISKFGEGLPVKLDRE